MPRRPRGKPDAPARPAAPERRDESVTARLEMTPEILASMLLDDSERPTVRMPLLAPFASPEDEELAREQRSEDATVRKRVVLGPDGLPQMIDADAFDEATRVGPPSKVLLARARTPKNPKKKGKR